VANIDQNDIQWLLDHPTEILNRSAHLQGLENGDDLHYIFLNAYKKGFRIIFFVSSSLSVVAFLFAFALMPQVELARQDEEKLKAEGKAYDQQLRQKKGVVGVLVQPEGERLDQRPVV
jgi:Tfp pilus assembly protein PilO